jgi:hypothetical protein
VRQGTNREPRTSFDEAQSNIKFVIFDVICGYKGGQEDNMTTNKTTQPLLPPHDALIQTEKRVLKYYKQPETDPFHPLEIVGFVMAGFTAVVLISVLIGRWYFDDPHKTPAKFLQQPGQQQPVKLAPR